MPFVARGSDDRRFLRGVGSVSAAVAFSRITGLVREIVMARLFGAGAVYDAFVLAFRVPNLMRDLFAEGALSSAFIPTFTQYVSGKGRGEAAELARVTATALIVVSGAACALGMIFSDEFVRLLAPGFLAVPGKAELASLLTRIMFPFITLASLAALAMGVLNACGRFGVPAMASAFFNIGSVAAGLALGFTVGRRYEHGLIVSMAFGVVAGGALQLLWQAPGLLRSGFSYRPSFGFGHPGLLRIAALTLPAFLGNAAAQINVLVNINFASGLTDAAGRAMDGPVSWLSYSFRFLQLPLGVFGVAIATVTLPTLSRTAAVGRLGELKDALERSLGLVLLLTIPAAVGLATLGESMIATVYEGGSFQAGDTRQTAAALACFSAGLAGYAAIKVLAPAFYAINDARTPMLVSIASVAANIAVAFSLVKWARMGHAGLALSTSLIALAGAAALFGILRSRMGGLHGSSMARNAAKILAAAAVMGMTCRGSSMVLHAALERKPANLADVALSIPLGVAVFYALARALRVDSLQLLVHGRRGARG